MKKVRILEGFKFFDDYCLGDAGGEGARFIKGNLMTVDDETAKILIGSAAAEEVI